MEGLDINESLILKYTVVCVCVCVCARARTGKDKLKLVGVLSSFGCWHHNEIVSPVGMRGRLACLETTRLS